MTNDADKMIRDLLAEYKGAKITKRVSVELEIRIGRIVNIATSQERHRCYAHSLEAVTKVLDL